MLVLAGVIGGTIWFRRGNLAKVAKGANEKSAFADLEKACRNNHAGNAHAAIYAWLACSPPLAAAEPRPATLGDFSRAIGDDRLSAELVELQQAMITPGISWNGHDLLSSLKRVRHAVNTHDKVVTKTRLTPLNP